MREQRCGKFSYISVVIYLVNVGVLEGHLNPDLSDCNAPVRSSWFILACRAGPGASIYRSFSNSSLCFPLSCLPWKELTMLIFLYFYLHGGLFAKLSSLI